MKPSAPVTNPLERHFIDAVVLSHRVTGLTGGVAVADFSNLLLSKLAASLSFSLSWIGIRALPAKDGKRVKLITSVVRNLKVLNPIVVLDAVKVVNHHPLRDGADVGLVDLAVRLNHSGVGAPGRDGHDDIAVLVPRAFYDLAALTDYAAHIGKEITRKIGRFFPNLCVFSFHTGFVSPAETSVNIQWGSGHSSHLC